MLSLFHILHTVSPKLFLAILMTFPDLLRKHYITETDTIRCHAE